MGEVISKGISGGGGVGSKGASLNVLKSFLPAHYARRTAPSILSSSTVAGRRTLVTPEDLVLELGGRAITIPQVSLDLDTVANWDSAYTGYTTAATRSGNDINLYATADALILSPNGTVPTGYTVDNSRKILGVHILCVDVGAITGHPLTGFLAGDILPASIWDLLHRPTCKAAGMVYSAQADLWVDIYLQSGTGAATASTYGATITDTRTWMDHTDDLDAVGKRLLWDYEFQTISAGSNQLTNIYGSTDPVTTGGHVDTAGRRMISNIGCEDCCGVMWQWLQDQQYRIGGIPDTGDPVFSWYTLPGSKGSIYRQGTSGDIKLLAGGAWDAGSRCGSRCRSAAYERWNAYSGVGARGCARSRGA